MESLALFSATLGLSPPWRISTVRFAADERRIDIAVSFDCSGTYVCPVCGRPVSPRLATTEIWFHDDFLQYPTYLSAEIPLLACTCGRELPVERPWTRPGSRFDLLH